MLKEQSKETLSEPSSAQASLQMVKPQIQCEHEIIFDKGTLANHQGGLASSTQLAKLFNMPIINPDSQNQAFIH